MDTSRIRMNLQRHCGSEDIFKDRGHEDKCTDLSPWISAQLKREVKIGVKIMEL